MFNCSGPENLILICLDMTANPALYMHMGVHAQMYVYVCTQLEMLVSFNKTSYMTQHFDCVF